MRQATTFACMALILSLSTALPALAGPAAGETATFLLDSDDDVEAAEALSSFLALSGFSVKNRQGDLMLVQRGDSSLILEPTVTATGLDRLVVTSITRLRAGTDRERLEAIVARLNEKTAGIQYSLDADGDLLCQFLLTFVDRLERVEVEKAFAFMERVQFTTLIVAPELLELLER